MHSKPNTSDRNWIVPFFLIIGAGVAFFFWQMAQFGLMLH